MEWYCATPPDWYQDKLANSPPAPVGHRRTLGARHRPGTSPHRHLDRTRTAGCRPARALHATPTNDGLCRTAQQARGRVPNVAVRAATALCGVGGGGRVFAARSYHGTAPAAARRTTGVLVSHPASPQHSCCPCGSELGIQRTPSICADGSCHRNSGSHPNRNPCHGNQHPTRIANSRAS